MICTLKATYISTATKAVICETIQGKKKINNPRQGKLACNEGQLHQDSVCFTVKMALLGLKSSIIIKDKKTKAQF